MSIDVSQFYQTFFEESLEGLDSMEAALLGLDTGAVDLDAIHAIFRAAHSIKGGSATFGFTQMAEFTHVMETLLDEMREGRREVTQEAVNLLLNSVDLLREMIEAAQAGTTVDEAQVGEVQRRLEAMLHGEAAAAVAPAEEAPPTAAPAGEAPPVADEETAPEASAGSVAGWRIVFRPYEHLLRTGNDPVRMFRELGFLGQTEVALDDSRLPPFEDMDPEVPYLAWTLEVYTDAPRERVEAVFEWVEGDCELDIRALGGADEVAPVADMSKGEEAPEAAAAEPETPASGETPKAAPEAAPPAEAVAEPAPAAPVAPAAEAHDDLPAPQAASAPEPAPAPAPESTPTAERPDAPTPAAQAAPSPAPPPSQPSTQAAPTAKASPAPAKPKPAARPKGDAGSIRVSIDKVDALINMVGELVITQSMLGQIGDDFDAFDLAAFEKLKDGLAQLERNTRELQESVMRIRMLPISFAFSRFPRMVRDLSQKLNKKIELRLSGESTELDKTVMEKIGDPLVHLVRNSIDHGIEPPQERLAAGKPETGVVHLNAYHQGGNIVIEIEDDGRGLDRDKLLAKAIERGLVPPEEAAQLPDERVFDLIFEPGFSTAEQVSDVSGRGVGMDVVKRNIRELGGTIDIASRPGEGTTLTIRLPLTLAILDGQLVQVGGETYILPLVSIVESLQVNPNHLNQVAGQAEVYQVRDEFVPVVRLHQVFGLTPRSECLEDGLLVIVEGDGQHAGLFVDDLLGQQQVVIKSLESNYKPVQGISGATILGDGTVALILDVAGLIRLAKAPGLRPPREAAA